MVIIINIKKKQRTLAITKEELIKRVIGNKEEEGRK